MPWVLCFQHQPSAEFFFADVPSACYTFTITPKPSPGQSWCEVQGQFIRGTFFNYTCSSQKFEPIGTLGMKLNATDFWNQLVERWKELVEELRKALLDYKQNISKARKFARSRVEVDSVVGLGNNCVFVNIGILSYPRGPTARVGHSGQIRTRRWGKQRAGY